MKIGGAGIARVGEEFIEVRAVHCEGYNQIEEENRNFIKGRNVLGMLLSKFRQWAHYW
jgi:hypothetical protein